MTVDHILDSVTEEEVTAFLAGHMRWIRKGETLNDLAKAQKDMVIGHPDAFITKVQKYTAEARSNG